MGLLDALLNPTPEQSAGLLAFSASLAKTSGPSLVPTSGAQGIASALQAYQQGVQSYQDRELQRAGLAQQQQLRGLQIKDAQSDLDNQQMVRDRNARIADRLAALRGAPMAGDGMSSGPGGATSGSPSAGLMNPEGLTPASHMNGSVFTDAAARAGLPGDMSSLNGIVDLVNRGQDPLQAALSIAGKTNKPSASYTPQTMASAMPGGLMSPKIGGPDWLQAYQQQNGLQLPMQSVSRSPNFNDQGSTSVPNLTQSVLARMTQEAQIRSEEGDLDGANKLYEHAVKFMPEVNKIEASLDPQTNKPINVIYFKDGTSQVSQFGPPPKIHYADNGRSTAIPINEYTGVQMGNGVEKYQSPDSAAVDRRAAADRAAGGDVAMSFSADAIKNAAARYNIDGSLPPMGMGKAGAQARVAILNEAANQKAGVSGDQQRWDQLNNKGVAAARTATLRDFSPAGKSGQALTAANTALNHLATLRELAQAQANGNTPAFNKIANEFAQATGNPAPTSLQAAITMVSPEVSKSVIGQAGGQEERAQFTRNFNPNASPQQALQGIGVIEELLGGRLTEAQRAYERGTKLNDFSDTMLSPAAQKVLARAQQHNVGATPPGAPAAPAGQFSVQAPNGKIFYFKTAKDMNNFKLTAGIR